MTYGVERRRRPSGWGVLRILLWQGVCPLSAPTLVLTPNLKAHPSFYHHPIYLFSRKARGLALALALTPNPIPTPPIPTPSHTPCPNSNPNPNPTVPLSSWLRVALGAGGVAGVGGVEVGAVGEECVRVPWWLTASGQVQWLVL